MHLTAGTMNRTLVLFQLFLYSAIIACPLTALGQDNGQVIPQGVTPGRGGELRAVVGYSPNSNLVIGVSPNRELYFTALEYEHSIRQFWKTTLNYYGGIVPFMAVHHPAESINGVSFPAATNWGGGAEPIGFAWNFRTASHFQPILETAGGVVYFNDQVPIADSSQFNFMFHFGAGIEFYGRSGHFLTIGYRYQHISNANTGHFNPGIDSNLIYIAVPIIRRTRTR